MRCAWKALVEFVFMEKASRCSAVHSVLCRVVCCSLVNRFVLSKSNEQTANGKQ